MDDVLQWLGKRVIQTIDGVDATHTTGVLTQISVSRDFLRITSDSGWAMGLDRSSLGRTFRVIAPNAPVSLSPELMDICGERRVVDFVGRRVRILFNDGIPRMDGTVKEIEFFVNGDVEFSFQGFLVKFCGHYNSFDSRLTSLRLYDEMAVLLANDSRLTSLRLYDEMAVLLANERFKRLVCEDAVRVIASFLRT